MAMFIRVKRKKTTYFLHCDPTETVLEIKQKIQALSDNPVDCQRLFLLSSQLILEDNKTLADQKGFKVKEPEQSEIPAEGEIVEGLHGVLLEDATTLADQQVENDAIVALCLKISDPRVHRIPTLMRPPHIPPAPSPIPTPPKVVEEVLVAPGEEAPSPLPLQPDDRMSTELRIPYRQHEEENDSEFGEKDSSLGGNSSRKDGSKKEKESQKEGGKKEAAKKDASKRERKQGKEPSGNSGKDSSKKVGKKVPKEEVPPAEKTDEPPEDGVWEDINIDKLTDYAALEDSD